MAKGGKRPGAGRKPGVPNKQRIPAHQKAKEIAYRALDDGENTPLEIMLEAARFFVAEARRLRALPGMTETSVAKPVVAGAKPIVATATAAGAYVAAAECAKKAAPYVHPTLSSAEIKASHQFEEALLSFDEAIRQAQEPAASDPYGSAPSPTVHEAAKV